MKEYSNIVSRELYGADFVIQERTDERVCYLVENETGKGVVTQYSVFPGIDILYNDFHMSDGFNQNKLEQPDMLEINHCKEGRFECGFQSGERVYLGAGDLALNALSNRTVSTYFPLAHYHGISIVVSLEDSRETIRNITTSMGLSQIDPLLIQSRLCMNNPCFIMRATDSIQHIFSELYTAPEGIRKNYFKVKIIELFLFLSAVDQRQNEQSSRYFARSYVQSVHEIKDFLTSNLDSTYSLEELSQRFNISLTMMKKCFRGIYGAPIHSYLRTYRMNKAAEMLRNTDIPIVDCALAVGYSNPSKFSDAFRREIGMLPSEYRNDLKRRLRGDPFSDTCHP